MMVLLDSPSDSANAMGQIATSRHPVVTKYREKVKNVSFYIERRSFSLDAMMMEIILINIGLVLN
jgi:hypothetical protein